MARKDKDQPPPSFELSIEQLEQIIERIEAGQVGLEESLSQYERGMKLIAHCRSILEKAETQILQLSRDGSGNLQPPDAAQPPADDEDSDAGLEDDPQA